MKGTKKLTKARAAAIEQRARDSYALFWVHAFGVLTELERKFLLIGSETGGADDPLRDVVDRVAVHDIGISIGDLFSELMKAAPRVQLPDPFKSVPIG